MNIHDTDYRVVSEYLEEQLWIAKERRDGPATRKLEMVLLAFDEVIELCKGENEDDSD
jgi:hypothetical protein